MFGGSKPGGFGAFGTTPSTFGTFGSTSTGFGGSNAFGSTAPAGGGLFGGGGASGSTGSAVGGLFGQQPGTGFGQPQAAGGFSFGSTPSSSTSGGLFGTTSQSSAGSSLFSSSTPAGGFGAKPQTFSGFGGTANPSGTGGLFGASTGTTSLFGQPSASGTFGATGSSAGGTTLAFQAPSGQDTMMKGGVATNINTRHQCITAMKEYEAKSLEELRTEDYTANRKAKQAGSTSTGGLFSQTPATQTSTGGGFVFGGGGGGIGTGLQSGSTGFGGFGSTSSAATTPFNQNRPLFGTATTTQSGFGFGTGTGTQQSSSLFGNSATPLFGGTSSIQQPPLAGGTSFFGASAAGATNPVGFGTSTGGSSLFGGAKPSAFGTSTTSALGFGTGGNLFAKPTSTASSFGFGTSTSTTGFGGTSGGSLFNMKPGGFGGTSTGGFGTGSSFGFGTGLGAGTSTTTFGTNTAKSTFGGFNFGGGTTGMSGFGSTLGGGTGASTFNLGGGTTTLGTSTASSQVNSNHHMLALASSPYGDNPLFWNLKQQSKERRDDALKPTNPNAQKAILSSANQYKVSPRPSTKIKPKSLHNLINGGKAQLFEGLEDEDFSFGDDTFIPRKSVKKLVLRKNPHTKSSSGSSSFYSDTAADTSVFEKDTNMNSTMPITRSLTTTLQEPDVDNEAEAVIVPCQEVTPVRGNTPGQQQLDETVGVLEQRPSSNNQPTNNCLSAADTTSSYLDTSDLDNSCLAAENISSHPTGIILTRPGYYTIPNLDEMVELIDENGNVFVEDLTIGRMGFGNIFFPGITNVAGMNVDDIVHFRRKEVVVYPDDDKKPPLGDGLNKKAEVTLDCVWPTDKSERTPIKSPERLKVMNYADKIEDTTARIGAKFIDYRPETGSWVFQVNHFSKYGLLDDSDEDDSTDQQKQALGQHVKDVLLVQKLKIQVQQQLQQKELAKKGKLAAGDDILGEQGQGDMQVSTSNEHGKEMLQGDEDEEGYEMQEVEETQVKKFLKGVQHEDEMDTSLDSKYMAASMGVSVKNIQGMKASFFGDTLGDMADVSKVKKFSRADMEDDEDMQSLWKKSGGSNLSSGFFGAFKHPGKLSLPQSPAFSDKEGYEPSTFPKSGLFDISAAKELLRPTPQTFLHPPVMEHKLIPSGLRPQDTAPRIVGTRIRHNILHTKDSVLYNNQETFIDAACYMGRSFRVGWGPAWSLVHSGSLMGVSEETSDHISLLPSSRGGVKSLPQLKCWQANLEQVQVTEYMDQRNAQVLRQQEELLQVQLNSAHVGIEDGCPLIVPEPGVNALHKLSNLVKSSLSELSSHPDIDFQKQTELVLGLCVALWGDLPDAADLDKEEIYRERQLRREALSQWLSLTGSSKVAMEMETSATNSETCLNAVFSKLTVRQISEACMLAQRMGDHHLALLLAQATGSAATRQMVSLQLAKWAERGMCEFISDLRQKVYSLLAGQLVWCGQERDINTCQGLDWKRALALHLWYKCPPNASIQHVLRQYQQGFQGSEHNKAYCASPLPPYLEEEGSGEECIFDTAYHLLCLYADQKYALEALLSPTSSTSSHLDFRLSWHLLQVLQSLGYTHISPHCSSTVHVSFASQLEMLGLWHWAAFVLLHLQDVTQRQSSVAHLLQRHVEVGEEFSEREQFLTDKLQIPAQWVHRAKAIRAGLSGNRDAEARHWLLAGHYNNGHRVVVRHLAADAIINDDNDYLKYFLDQISPPERSLGVLGWSGSGKVFLDFINIRRRLDQLQQSEPTASDLEELKPAILSLCSRVKGLQCFNSKDRLCQAEMAKTAASLLRTLLTLQGDSPVQLLSQHIPELPMPEDYTLQELQALTRAYLVEIV